MFVFCCRILNLTIFILNYLNFTIIHNFINIFTPLSDEEMKQYLISLNPNWQKALECLDREEITQIDLTPVGLYIGRRIVKKVTKDDTLPLEDFYK